MARHGIEAASVWQRQRHEKHQSAAAGISIGESGVWQRQPAAGSETSRRQA
jgi:hypothetical protein